MNKPKGKRAMQKPTLILMTLLSCLFTFFVSACDGGGGGEDADADMVEADTGDHGSDADAAEHAPDADAPEPAPDADGQDPAPDTNVGDADAGEVVENPCSGVTPGNGAETDDCDGQMYCNWTRCQCYPPHECVEASDCSNPGNDWPHDACAGHAECTAGLCEWICS
jgi:hypothetical protein